MPDVATKGRPRPKHVPQRTCVGCATVTAKRGLIRVVRAADGEVEADPTGKKAGRGAYVHADRRCWRLAMGKKGLERSLKIALTPKSRAALTAFAETLPEGTGE